MLATYLPLLFASLVVCFYFCFKRREGFSVDVLILKVATSLCYLLCGTMALILTGAYVYGGLMIFGAILGLCGDAFLDMKGIYPESKSIYKKTGFSTFLIGHLFYISAMLFTNRLKVWQVIICIVISIGISVGNILLEKKMQMNYRQYKNLVLAYGVVLFSTLSISFVCLIVNGFSISRFLMLIGAILFTISDLILSSTYFKEGCDGPMWYFSNHLSYYLAQFAFMTSILFINY